MHNNLRKLAANKAITTPIETSPAAEQFQQDTTNAIKQLMSRNKIYNKELARRMDLPREAVDALFTDGSWTLATLYQVATALGAEASILVAPDLERLRPTIDRVLTGKPETLTPASLSVSVPPPVETAWIYTYTGKRVYPFEPQRSEFDIRDIAHSLSLLCRFNGHCRNFYSVAEHCCLVSDLLPPPHKLEGLLHDASEAYIGDWPRPLKQAPGVGEMYRLVEDALMQHIALTFNLIYPFYDQIHDADRQLLATEVAQLHLPVPDDWDGLGEVVAGLRLSCWTPNEAERQFLRRFHRLI
jgi:uncharacterized protein